MRQAQGPASICFCHTRAAMQAAAVKSKLVIRSAGALASFMKTYQYAHPLGSPVLELD